MRDNLLMCIFNVQPSFVLFCYEGVESLFCSAQHVFLRLCVCVESVLKELVDSNVGLSKHHSYINNILKTFFLYPLAIREDACFVQIVQFWLSNT